MIQNDPSLIVYLDELVIFQSYGIWLYPLFDFEDHLKQNPVEISRAALHDKVIGKAAAMLIVRLGVGYVHGKMMSSLARQVFENWKRPYSFDKEVARIACQTEKLLVDIDDPDEAYLVLCKRANRC